MTEPKPFPFLELGRARSLAAALTWTEDGDGTPLPGGDVGGDAQLDGAAFSRAWWAELPNGLFARVQATFFIGEAPQRRHSDVPADELRSIHVQTEYLICSDRADPGGTELASEYVDHDDVAPDLRPTDANVLAECQRLSTEDAAWPVHEDRVLRLLTFGLVPVEKSTRVRTTSASTRWLFVGKVPVGVITEVEAAGTETVYLAYAHDWHNGGPVPGANGWGQPNQAFDPAFVQLCPQWDDAVAEIVRHIPPTLTTTQEV